MTLDLDALEAVARAATPDGELGSYTFAGVGKLQQFQSKVSPSTVLALITRLREAETRLREAEAVIEAARESEARTKLIAWGRKPTYEDSSQTWRILTAYKPTNPEGGNDGT